MANLSIQTIALRNARLERERNGTAKTGDTSGWPDSYNPEEILAHPEDHPIEHVFYAEVNCHIRDTGSTWSTCANCGEVFEGDATVCGESCSRAYSAYIMDSLY